MTISGLITIVAMAGAIFGCAKKHPQKAASFTNKTEYNIKTGDTVNIFYTTNSCCYYCVLNRSELKHTVLIDDKIVNAGPADCEGCDHTSAFVFKGISKGIDSVILSRNKASESCGESNDYAQSMYIIIVD